MDEFTAIDELLQQLLAEFRPSNAAKSRHYPFWHLATDGHGALWDLSGPRAILTRPAPPAPLPAWANCGRIASRQASRPMSTRPCATFPACCRRWRRGCSIPASLRRCTPTSWPRWAWTLTAPVNCATAHRPLPTTPPRNDAGATPAFGNGCCAPTSTGAASAALTFASGTHRPAWWPRTFQWHHVGGPDIEPNVLSLCALHHKLFDLGVFTVEPAEHRVVFSQHAISGGRGMEGELQFHGRAITMRRSMPICYQRLSFWRGTRRTCSRCRLGEWCWMRDNPSSRLISPDNTARAAALWSTFGWPFAASYGYS